MIATETAGKPLAEHVALVTGGGAGIGRAVCRALAVAGASVCVVDVDDAGARAVAEELAGDALACRADVSDPGEVTAAVARAVEAFGRIDVLVNNAAIATVTPFLEHDLETWRRVFAVNVEGALCFTTAVASIMCGQDVSPMTGCRGKIVNISSPAAEVGRPLLASYGASKAALNHLSKSTALVLGDELVSTTVVYPMTVADGMWSQLGREYALAEGRSEEEIVRERLGATPSGRFQTAEEVAAIVVFAARYPGMGLNGRLLWSEAHAAPL